MNTNDVKTQLRQLRNAEAETYFAMKQYGGGADESFIEANRNGIIAFAELLVDSLDELDEKKTFGIPAEFYDDDSDVIIGYIKLKEGKHKPVEKESILTQIGCMAAIAVMVIIFIVGCITSISWLNDLL